MSYRVNLYIKQVVFELLQKILLVKRVLFGLVISVLTQPELDLRTRISSSRELQIDNFNCMMLKPFKMLIC